MGFPQGSALGPLLFPLYINNLHKAMMHCSVHHFADDTNPLLIDKSLKGINKHINHQISTIISKISRGLFNPHTHMEHLYP